VQNDVAQEEDAKRRNDGASYKPLPGGNLDPGRQRFELDSVAHHRGVRVAELETRRQYRVPESQGSQTGQCVGPDRIATVAAVDFQPFE
jgi:hypothetical protein